MGWMDGKKKKKQARQTNQSIKNVALSPTHPPTHLPTQTDAKHGLSEKEVETRRALYGRNALRVR